LHPESVIASRSTLSAWLPNSAKWAAAGEDFWNNLSRRSFAKFCRNRRRKIAGTDA
jgi:hypothetical protein